MVINKIKISSFGKLKNIEIDFKENVNIIYGYNESGKSTIIAFIKSCLYGLSSRGNDSNRKRYTPWDEESFGGETYFTHNGIKYRYICHFGKTKRSDTYVLYNNVTGEQIKLQQNQVLGEYLFDLSEGAFDSSIYAPQLQSKIDASKDKTGQILSKLAESSGSDTSRVNTAEKRLKSYIDKIKTPRGQNGILDKLYIAKKESELRLYEIIDKENKMKTIKEEYENLNKEKINIENSIKLYYAKESIKTKNTIMEKLAIIDKLQESINNDGSRNKKNQKIALLIISFLLILISIIVYISPITPYFVLIPLTLSVLFLFISVKRNNFSHNISLTMKELEKEEAILDHILGDKSITEHENEWKNAETVLSQYDNKVNNDNIDSLKKRLEQLNNEITYKKALLESSDVKDNYTQVLNTLSNIEQDIELYKNKYTALKIAYETMLISFDELQSTFGPVVSDKIGEILSILTDSEHDNVRISKELDISLDESDGFHNASSYSGGTIDQIYLAFRLAIAQLISIDALPIYLDEPFVQYDDNRISRAIDYLCEYSKENNSQIILTSCHDRIIGKQSKKVHMIVL